MKQFEVGKTYKAGGGEIKIIKRTRCYITYEGDFSGRSQIKILGNGLFDLCENVWPRKNGKLSVLCLAGFEKGDQDE